MGGYTDFHRRVEPDLNSGCWLWSGAQTSDGYGYLRPFGGTRNVRAHRWSLVLAGRDPGPAVVLHACDTPLCVNPAHLRVGTHADNVADMHAKGRARGPLGKRWRLPEGSRSAERHPRWGLRKSECKNGHAFTPENTALAANGSQRCKTCARDRALAAYHRGRVG